MLYDRHRIPAFLRFTVRRFLDDRCLATAGALAYTSLFALVPVTAAILGIISGFPAFAQWRENITRFVFANFVPAAGDVVQTYLTQFADNASKATAVGIVVLLVSTLMLMLSVEDAFNRIWRVSKDRPAGARFVMYWTVLTLGPLLLIVALAISSYVFALPFIDNAEARYSIKAHVLGLLPFLIGWIALVAAYVLIPNRTVRVRDATLGALIAVVLFEAAKRAFASYITSGANYEEIYGALAVVPIFILWIYLSWVIVLLGASLTATLTAFDYRPRNQRLAHGEEFRGLVRVIAYFAAAQRAGRGLHSADLSESEPFLTDDLVQRYLADLDRGGVIQRNDRGEWVMTRDPAAVNLYDVYAASGYRIPLGQPLPAAIAPASDAEATRLIEQVTSGLRTALSVPLAEIFPAPARSQVTAAPHNPTPEKAP